MQFVQASLFCLLPDEELYMLLFNDVVKPFDAFATGSRPVRQKSDKFAKASTLGSWN
jgi:hypothetical protein